ncbi:hypothetical protein GUJ93_ZPchr0001g29667 [Zizania palustris]|uniref:Reverse transcriptase domain-containing protein n=1 Tax=Zizania palustris TaxID=103762 RepID=A0A8J5SC20_ZIZPA|nr:hypothetical protein GUJ93_ZPchr0001g29667 [Zizania palustris]
MKSNTAPGPDGFYVNFFRTFWGYFRLQFKEMLDDLHKNDLNLGRINYGEIVLLPKIKDACSIKQFIPICLLNVCYKIITRVLTLRLTKVTEKVIDSCQAAFIPRRNILDGVVLLHEVLHEVNQTK